MQRIRNLPHSFATRFARTARSLSGWRRRRAHVRNWWSCWLVSSALTAPLAMRLGGHRRFVVAYQDGLRMAFGARMWEDLAGIVDTYEGYLARSRFVPRSGDLVVDVGAHVGSFSVVLAYRHPHLRVLAFEPDPDNFRDLVENIRMNALTDRVEATPAAVADLPGSVVFRRGRTSTTGGLADITSGAAPDTTSTVHVNAVSLRSMIPSTGVIRLLKMDCEGCEYRVLGSLDDRELRTFEHIILEAHPTRDGDPRQLRDRLVGAGFNVREELVSKGCVEMFCEIAGAARSDADPDVELS